MLLERETLSHEAGEGKRAMRRSNSALQEFQQTYTSWASRFRRDRSRKIAAIIEARRITKAMIIMNLKRRSSTVPAMISECFTMARTRRISVRTVVPRAIAERIAIIKSQRSREHSPVNASGLVAMPNQAGAIARVLGNHRRICSSLPPR